MSIEWTETTHPEWLTRASDDDEGWELYANDFGFSISWGALTVTCDTNDLAQAQSEAVYALNALRQWNRQASQRDLKRRLQGIARAARTAHPAATGGGEDGGGG